MNLPGTATPPGRTPWFRAATTRVTLLVLLAGALAIRIPAFFSRDHLGFDDGVYGISALAMRAGEIPYRDIFCPQGPLFLPLVFVADLLGLRTLNAPRLLPLAAGVAVTAATWAAARQLRLPRPGPEVAAGLVATSGIVLWVTGPITGDGPALALATAAIAATLWWRNGPTPGRAAVVGLAIGAALSTKSLVIPAAAPIAWALLRGPLPAAPDSAAAARLRHIGAAAGAALAVGLTFALAWGISDVWDQSVRYHLDGGTDATPIDNIRKLTSTLFDRDLLLLAAGAAVALQAWDRHRRAGEKVVALMPLRAAKAQQPGESTGLGLIAVWLVLGFIALVIKDPLYRNHMSSLAPPAALLVGAGAPAALARWQDAAPARRALGLLVLAAVGVYHVAHNQPILWPGEPSANEAAARADLAELPDGAWAISDEPGYVWREDRRTPSYLVDASVTRVIQERITARIIADAAAQPEVCAVLVWSHRYGRFADLPQLLSAHDYSVKSRYGGEKVLYVKDPCSA